MAFEMSDVETAHAKAWVERHKKRCPVEREWKRLAGEGRTSAIGGQYSYTFTQTGIGTAVTVSCSCGKSENVTDYDSW